jgi:sporulation protein YlmC with PRC-barrel domain
MTKARDVRRLLTTAALGGLIAVAPSFGSSVRSADPPSYMQSPANSLALQQSALAALAEAYKAARRGDGHVALDQIERAETALLNLEQIQADPRIEHNLLRLDLARSAIGRKDNRVADELLASAAHSLTGVFAVAAAGMPSGTSPMGDAIRPDQMRASQMIGEPVYDGNDQAVGRVLDLVLDQDGTVDAVVIALPGAGGVVIKTVAVPMSEITTANRRQSVERTRDQVQQSATYQLDTRGAPTASGGSATTAPTGSGAPAPRR